MQFDLLKDPERIARVRESIQAEWQHRHDEQGNIVRYVMPAVPAVCPLLSNAIQGSAHRLKYMGLFYYVQSKNRHIRQLVPVPEYHKFALGAVADERQSLSVAQSRLTEVLAGIQSQWEATRETLPHTGQPSFWVAEYVYALKAELAAALFFARALLDTFSTLSHLLYSPGSKRFSSFADLLKHVSKDDATDPSDPVFSEYAKTNMSWFFALRDFRDFVTHYSSMRVEFYERDGRLTTYVHHSVRPDVLVADTVQGIDAFLAFADDHFVQRFVERAPV